MAEQGFSLVELAGKVAAQDAVLKRVLRQIGGLIPGAGDAVLDRWRQEIEAELAHELKQNQAAHAAAAAAVQSIFGKSK